MISILTEIKEKIPVAAIQAISNLLGENPRDTAIGLDSVLPYLLSEVCKASSSETGISKIESISSGIKPDLLNRLSDIFNDDMQGFGLIQTGTRHLNELIGNSKLSNIVEKISTETAIKKSSIASLLGLSTPLILQNWRENIFRLKSGEEFLTFLEQQKTEAEQQIAPYLKDELLETPINAQEASIPNNVENISTPPQTNKPSGFKKEPSKFSWLPWLLVGTLGWGTLFLLKNYKPTLTFLNDKLFSSETIADTTVSVKTDTIRPIQPSPLAEDFKESNSKDKIETLPNKEIVPLKTQDKSNSTPIKNNNPPSVNNHSNSSSFEVGDSWKAFSSRDNGVISGIANYLNSNPNSRIKVVGEFYTEQFDSNCSIRDRRKSSFNSACTVKRKLEKQGIAGSRIDVGTVNQSFKGGNVAVKTL